jgi:hypothetical protein
VCPPGGTGKKRTMPPKTQREREAAQREAKLERMQEQVDDGSLVIRQMTEEERARFAGRRTEPSGSDASKRRTRRTRSTRPLPPVPR